jgi:hypothetical protein
MATEILRIHVLSVAGLLKSHHSRDLMVVEFAITFNNIAVISWRSDLLVKETGENDQPVASH